LILLVTLMVPIVVTIHMENLAGGGDRMNKSSGKCLALQEEISYLTGAVNRLEQEITRGQTDYPSFAATLQNRLIIREWLLENNYNEDVFEGIKSICPNLLNTYRIAEKKFTELKNSFRNKYREILLSELRHLVYSYDRNLSVLYEEAVYKIENDKITEDIWFMYDLRSGIEALIEELGPTSIPSNILEEVKNLDAKFKNFVNTPEYRNLVAKFPTAGKQGWHWQPKRFWWWHLEKFIKEEDRGV